MVSGKRAAQPVPPDLGEHRIRIHQHPAPALFQLRDPVDVAQVEVDVALATKLRQTLARYPIRGAVLRQVTPAVLQTVWSQHIQQVGDTIAGISGHLIAGGVIARVGPPVILEVGHFMPQPLEAHQVLEVVPAKSAERIPDQVTRADYLQAHCNRPCASSSNRVRTLSESKYSSAIARAAPACRPGSLVNCSMASVASSGVLNASTPSPIGITFPNPVSCTT